MLLPNKLPNFISVKEVSKILAISYRRVQAMCQSGIIENAYKVNREWIIGNPFVFSKRSYRYKKQKKKQLKSDGT